MARRAVARRPSRRAVRDVPKRAYRRRAAAEVPAAVVAAPARSRRSAVTSLVSPSDAVIAGDQAVGHFERRPDISRAVEAVIKSVAKAHGDDAIERLDATPEHVIGVVPTGLPALDGVFGIGGLPMAKLVQVVGPESVGKSALAKLFIAACQRAGVVPYFIDGEMSKDTPERYAAMAIDTSMVPWTEALYIEDAFAMAFTATNALKKQDRPAIIFMDSIAAFQVKSAAERQKAGEEFEGAGGRPEKALFLSANLPRLVHAVQGTHVGIVFVNQLRQKARAMPFEDPYYEVGGLALRYWCHTILRMRSFGKIKDGASGPVIGVKTRVQAKKNKLAPPFRHADLEIYFDGRIVQGEFTRIED